MAVRVRIRIETAQKRKTAAVETVAVANSGFESEGPKLLLPVRLAERLGFWPPPPGASTERYDSPAAAFTMIAFPKGIRVSLAGRKGRGVLATGLISEHETEAILNDHLVESLGLDLVAVARGLYRVGRRGRILKSEKPQTW